ncbi:hypothetical protein [Clostridium akagii]|uniref:hypothetical protein n=1 Tax=Clostridium akagii TaxID=91623 RepID=UPI000A44477B|nr:hypothetical protein [Clostridium akagii]
MNKTVSIYVLVIFNILIIMSGAFFIIYSILFKISIKVLNTNISGVIFGIVVLYFGIRYFINLLNLKKEVNKQENKFSWSNFKKTKRGKGK